MLSIPCLASSTSTTAPMRRAINDDLADLNSQIDNSIVIRDIAAVDDTAHTVSLTTDEVDRLGEGSVQIEATQTDAVGNCMKVEQPPAASLSTR